MVDIRRSPSGPLVEIPDGALILASNAINLPFDIPISGGFGTPDGMTLVFGPSEIEDQFIIDSWVEIFNGDVGNAHTIDAQLERDGNALVTTGNVTIDADGRLLFTMKWVDTLVAPNAAPEYRAAYRSDGGGPDVVAGSISVIKVSAP